MPCSRLIWLMAKILENKGSMNLSIEHLQKAADFSRDTSLYFQLGEVVFADSTFPEEDLGEILYSLGKIDRTSLLQARQFETERTKVGKILVSKGQVSPKDLWLATRNRVETVVFNLFAVSKGGYAFLNGGFAEEDIVRLSMRAWTLG